MIKFISICLSLVAFDLSAMIPTLKELSIEKIIEKLTAEYIEPNEFREKLLELNLPHEVYEEALKKYDDISIIASKSNNSVIINTQYGYVLLKLTAAGIRMEPKPELYNLNIKAFATTLCKYKVILSKEGEIFKWIDDSIHLLDPDTDYATPFFKQNEDGLWSEQALNFDLIDFPELQCIDPTKIFHFLTNSFLAITLDHRLLGWGDNSFGRLGPKVVYSSKIDKPIEIELPEGFLAKKPIDLNDIIVVLSKDGRLYRLELHSIPLSYEWQTAGYIELPEQIVVKDAWALDDLLLMLSRDNNLYTWDKNSGIKKIELVFAN